MLQENCCKDRCAKGKQIITKYFNESLKYTDNKRQRFNLKVPTD